MAINRISGNILQDNLQRGANLSVQGNLVFFDVDHNLVGFGTSAPTDLITAAGNVRVGNILVEFGGNVNLGNVWINQLQDPVADTDAATKQYVDASAGSVSIGITDGSNVQTVINGDTITLSGTANQTTVIVSATDTATFALTDSVTLPGNISAANAEIQHTVTASDLEITANISGGNIVVTGSGAFDTATANLVTAGNATVTGTVIVPVVRGNTSLALESVANANITIDPGTGLVVLATTSGLSIPAGNTDQRPADPPPGTIRYNVTTSRIELYDGAEWDEVVSDVINQTITPTGSDENFALTRPATAASLLVNINGVVQLPNVAYTVTGNVISFAEAPLSVDIIDIRFL